MSSRASVTTRRAFGPSSRVNNRVDLRRAPTAIITAVPESCRLDTLLQGDLPYLIDLFTCPVVRRFLGGPLDEQQARQRAKDWIQCSRSASIWAIRRCADQAFLGYVLLDQHHDGKDTELSYALLSEYWGRGHATDAVRQALALASTISGLRHIVAETQAENHRSVSLLKRVGMTEERRLTRFGEEQVVFTVELRGQNN